MTPLTNEQVEAYERGILDLDVKIERAKKQGRGWVEAAHRHSRDTMAAIIQAAPRQSELEMSKT